jgi:hypothetical protein
MSLENSIKVVIRLKPMDQDDLISDNKMEVPSWKVTARNTISYDEASPLIDMSRSSPSLSYTFGREENNMKMSVVYLDFL